MTKPKSPFDNLRHSPPFLIRRIAQLFEAAFEASTGGTVTEPQYLVLCAVRDKPYTSQRDLVTTTGIDRSTMNVLIKAMKVKHMLAVTFREDDRRSTEVKLLPPGERALHQGDAAAEKAMRHIFGGVSPRRLTAFRTTARSVVRHVGANVIT